MNSRYPRFRAVVGAVIRSKSMALMGLAVGILVGSLWGSSEAMAATIPLENACDVLVVPVGEGIPGDPLVIEAAAGDTIQLTADSFCDGNGITIEANGVPLDPDGFVTFDLNGFDIISNSNLELESGGEDENHGVAVGGQFVKVTNSNLSECSVVENFTSNFDYGKGSDGSRLEGSTSLSETPGLCDPDGAGPALSYNLKGGTAHGGGVFAADRTQKLTVRKVMLYDPGFDENEGLDPLSVSGAGAGDSGIDWKRCSGPAGVIEYSHIEGILGGMRVRGCKSGGTQEFTVTNGPSAPSDPTKNYGLVVRYNTIIGNGVLGTPGVGVEVTRDVENAIFYGNTIQGLLAGGVGMDLGGGSRTKNITILPQVQGATAVDGDIQADCDIDISAGVTGILITPPSPTNANVPTLSGSTFTYSGDPNFFRAGSAPATCVTVP